MADTAIKLPDDISETVRRALEEDVGAGDRTATFISPEVNARAHVITRTAAVLCGAAWFDEVFRQVDKRVRIDWKHRDGEAITPGQTLCNINGPARALLTGERAALNFLQLLSGTATLARKYVEAVRGTRAVILDTRKTVPGLRRAQKYAVACGGATNHRMGLYDAVLIKENHITASGSIAAALHAAQSRTPSGMTVEIEVENLDQLREALEAGAKCILLDNFNLEAMKRAVQETAGRVRLEASGGITLANVRAVAETGVDFISVGELTKNVAAVDLSMRIEMS